MMTERWQSQNRENKETEMTKKDERAREIEGEREKRGRGSARNRGEKDREIPERLFFRETEREREKIRKGVE